MSAKTSHPKPRRQGKALRSALVLAAIGVVFLALGMAAIWLGTANGYLVALAVVGVTIMLLAPVWYFTYMESLEPELYQHDT